MHGLNICKKGREMRNNKQENISETSKVIKQNSVEKKLKLENQFKTHRSLIRNQKL